MTRRYAAAIVLAFVLGGRSVPAQTIAVLDRGPEPSVGVPYLAPNLVPYYRGEYDHNGLTVVIAYTTKEFFSSSEPEPEETAACGGLSLGVLPSAGRRTLYLPREYAILFFSFPDEYENPCAFVERFMIRLEFFRRASPESRVPPFPAVLEFAR